MTKTSGEKTIKFIKVELKADDVRDLVIAAARKEANVPANYAVPNGLVSIEPDNYGGFIVLVQKKDE